MPPGDPTRPVVIDVGAAAPRKMIPGAIVAAIAGIFLVVSMATGGDFVGVSGGPLLRIALGAFGVFLLMLAVLPVAMRRVAGRPHRLVFDTAGVRWDDPRGRPWAVRCEELAAV